MDYELRVVIEKVAVETQAVVKRDTLEVYEVVPPESILELGLRHTAQISLLQKLLSGHPERASGLPASGSYRLSELSSNAQEEWASNLGFSRRLQRSYAQAPKTSVHPSRLPLSQHTEHQIDLWHKHPSRLSQITV